MKEFNSFKEFDNYLKKILEKEKLHMAATMDALGQFIEDEAKRKFGIYQQTSGPYPAWLPLAESTKKQRVAQGYAPDNPLYRSGDLMNSIHHKSDAESVVIGSNEDIMVWQELGTHTIPERPVLGPAAFENKIKIGKIIGAGVWAWLTGKPPIDKKSIYFK